MTSVIRVKRKRECEPAEALLFARKKMKRDSHDSDAVPRDIAAGLINIEQKVFHFAGTVEPEIAHLQDAVAKRVKEAIDLRNERKYFTSVRKRKLPPKFITSPCPGLPKIKHLKDATIAACQSVLSENCLKFSSSDPLGKSLLSPSAQECKDCTDCHGADHILPGLNGMNHVVDEVLCNDTKMLREKVTVLPKQQCGDDEYVYDLYYSKSTSTDWDMSELLYIHPYKYTEHDLVNVSDSDEENYDDEDDSNDEDNWRNDYPDEEDESSQSSSCSEDDRERLEQEEDDIENAVDTFDGSRDDVDDLCAQFLGVRDWENFNLEEEEAEAFDHDHCDGGED